MSKIIARRRYAWDESPPTSWSEIYPGSTRKVSDEEWEELQKKYPNLFVVIGEAPEIKDVKIK